MHIGLDFDNTIICYDLLFHAAAQKKGLLGLETAKNKRAVRDAIRLLPDGEILWQKLQAEVYGPLICEAKPSEGLTEFLAEAAGKGCRISIVSHKNHYAAQDISRSCDLIDAARGWLELNGIVGTSCPVHPDSAYFEPARSEKAARIGMLGCDVFVDDLEETFLEKTFPAGARRIMFDPSGDGCSLAGVEVCRSWAEITLRLLEHGS